MKLALLLFFALSTIFCSLEAVRYHPRRGLAAAAAGRHRKLKYHDEGEAFVVLVSGSNGWYNYRHQADVAHAYHTLRNHGIPEENIITLMYDDIANNQLNPYKGKLFNRPHGKDLYKGLKIDYKGSSVTPENFLNILQGNASAIDGGNGRVLETNENDRIFIYFTDHGSVGMISFPDGILTVKQLNDALISLHKNKKYQQLVFYLEACESGSMFESVLRDDMDIYAITAANGHESSWGTFCENDMNLPCLGDLFSVNWMTDSDGEDLTTETLEFQYELVKKETNLSHVLQFGDKDIAKEAVALFQGDKEDREYTEDYELAASQSTNWPARDIELNHLTSMLKKTNDYGAANKLELKIQKIKETRRAIKRNVHMIVEKMFDGESEDLISRVLTQTRPVLDLRCHHITVNLFKKYCIDFNRYEYAMKYVKVLNNMCLHRRVEEIILALPDICLDVNIEDEVSEQMGYFF
uniref:legumain n=1 Tax=Caenorhabditis japonica TaxID=281687 RepID=A0A8R1DXX1_CAEJA